MHTPLPPKSSRPPANQLGENTPPHVHPDAPPDGPVGISPRVDLVFQRIFGAPGSEPLLIDLLNSVLRPRHPIAEVRLLNPVLSPEAHDGRLIVVDLVAIDDQGAQVQVEMQTTAHSHLRPRMLHGWARLYGGQLGAGQPFSELRPVISVWFCDRDALPAPPPSRPRPFAAHFEVAERGGGRVLSDHFGLHVIELRRFRAAVEAPQPEDRWLHFLAEAEGWRAVPPLLHSEPLEAAMTLLHSIRADPKERALLEAYNKRLSIEATYAEDLAEERSQRLRAEANERRAEAELEEERRRAAVAAEALRAKLRALGIDPDAAS
jgi:predicted transposase/invertase (TIGR01784 family)